MSDTKTVELVECHICLADLKPHPLYPIDVAMTCLRHGDFFIQRLRGEEPKIVFRSFADVVYTPKTTRRNLAGHPGTIVRCEQTGEVFENLKLAAEELGIQSTRISMYLSGQISHVKGYTFERLSDLSAANELYLVKPRIRFGGGVAPLRIKCEQTGIIFESARDAARIMRLSRSALFRHLKDPVNHPRLKGYKFTKLDT